MQIKRCKDIIFLTGRPERYRHTTHKWLSEYFKFDIKILMRKDRDKRNKIIIKKEYLNQISIKMIFVVIDNDLDLIHMWNELSLVTFNAVDI